MRRLFGNFVQELDIGQRNFTGTFEVNTDSMTPSWKKLCNNATDKFLLDDENVILDQICKNTRIDRTGCHGNGKRWIGTSSLAQGNATLLRLPVSFSCPMSTIPFDFASRIDASIKKSNFYIKWHRNFSNWRSDCWSWCKQGSYIDHHSRKYSTSNLERKRRTIDVLLLFSR